MDHRRLQRTLFRMQHDPSFAERLRAGDTAAVASTARRPAELACLQAVEPAALSADRAGRRRAQLLRNVASEFSLALAVGPDGDGDAGWAEAFPSTLHFHEAIARDERLPLAFARHAEETAARSSHAPFRSLVSLEIALARARRQPVAVPPLPALRSDESMLAPCAALLSLPAGSFDCASRVREALDAGATVLPLPATLVREDEQEMLLLVTTQSKRAQSLPAILVEPLAPIVAEFLTRARVPLSRASRARFATDQGVDEEDVEAVAAEYLAEGVLRSA